MRLEAHLAQHREYGFGLCATRWKATGEFIGRCGLEPRAEESGLAGDLAWMFGPSWWGKGLGTEVGSALVRHGLKRLGCWRVYATADRQNTASISIMRRIGMEPVREDARGVEYEVRAASGQNL